MKNNKNGFTLVEMAIGLVVVSLVIAGTLMGQSLIKSSQLTSIATQFRKIDNATNTFIQKYENLPGDVPHADKLGLFYPHDKQVGPYKNIALSKDANGTVDANGNGNGVLENYAQNMLSFGGEMANFWVNLSNSGILDGGYGQTTNCIDAACGTTPGVNFPKTPVGAGIIAVSHYSPIATSHGSKQLYYFNGIGTLTNFNGKEISTAAAGDTLTPEQAYGIDSRIDDGKPDTGTVQVLGSYVIGSVNGDTSLSSTDCYAAVGGDYNLAVTTRTCSISVKANIKTF